MRVPRFHLRTLMLIVAVLGGVLGWLLERRATSLRLEAARHAGDRALVSLEEIHNPWTDAGKEHHRAMAEKYRRAASHPWLPVTPDPPEPE